MWTIDSGRGPGTLRCRPFTIGSAFMLLGPGYGGAAPEGVSLIELW